MERRLCDDDGMVSEQPCTEENLFAPGVSYLGQINNLRAHGGHPPVAVPFACTGSAHLVGEHIRCTSPAHIRVGAVSRRNSPSVVHTAPELLEPVWTALADGAARTGHLRESDHDVARCVASNALAALHIAGYAVVRATMATGGADDGS